MIKRMGGRAWRRLHYLVYVIGGLAALHLIWLAKVGRRDQYVYAAILVLLLSVRAWDALHRRWQHRPDSGRSRRAAAVLPALLQ